MGELHERHSPLLAGIKVASSADINPGTLTGLATRNTDGLYASPAAFDTGRMI